MPKSPLEGDIEKVTSEYNVQEDWQLIMDICDRVDHTPNHTKDHLKCIMKRVNHQVPHVGMQALTLLAACVNNCGKKFHLELCSRDWINEARSVITKAHDKISERLLEYVEKWASDFKDDAQLHLMVQFHKKLNADGFYFSKNKIQQNSSPSRSKREEDEINFKEDLDLAIAMSLQTESSPSRTSTKSLYPSVTSSVPSAPLTYQEREICQVRALYDFEAAEDNEMTFQAGEIFSVLDNSDQNWWKGRNGNGTGLFPANFVTTDLSEPKSEKKKVRFADGQNSESQITQKVTHQKVVKPKVTINDDQLDLTLSMLKNASPNEIDDEEETICSMEESAKEMGSMIEKKVLECDRQKNDLNDLNESFLQAIALYQQLMKEPANTPPPQPVYQHAPSALQYQQAYANHAQFPPQYVSTQEYASQLHTGKSYFNQNTMMNQPQPTSLPPQINVPLPHISPQPSSLPPMSVSSQNSIPQQNAVTAPYSAQFMLQSSTSLPYHYSQAAYGQQQQTPAQYDGTDNGRYIQPVDYSYEYGYNVPQNTQPFQPVYH